MAIHTIKYERFQGKNAVYAKMSKRDYKSVCVIIQHLLARTETLGQEFEVLFKENKRFGNNRDTGLTQNYYQFLTGLLGKSLQGNDFTLIQLQNLNVTLRHVGMDEIELTNKERDNNSDTSDIFSKFFEAA